MLCLIQLDQEALVGTADFGDRSYEFAVDAHSYGALRPSVFSVRLLRDGRSVVNPARARLVEEAVRQAWVD